MMNPQTFELIRLMSDGQVHSGQVLGEALGVSRAAVWKSLRSLEALGITVSGKRGQGYCISGGLSLLDKTTLVRLCEPETRHAYQTIDVLATTNSTNAHLLEQIARDQNGVHRRVCLAELQTAGRGRRGRQWQSPFARNIYLSITWPFSQGVAALEGLSLAVGVAMVDALAELGINSARLKWPNDLVVAGAKLGGILIEMSGDLNGDCHAVVGVGLNVAMAPHLMDGVDQPWTDLAALSQELPSRNVIAAALLDSITRTLKQFEQHGFGIYHERWESLNAYAGESVKLIMHAESIVGEMLGVSASGALRLLVDGEPKEFYGGEISLRPVRDVTP